MQGHDKLPEETAGGGQGHVGEEHEQEAQGREGPAHGAVADVLEAEPAVAEDVEQGCEAHKRLDAACGDAYLALELFLDRGAGAFHGVGVGRRLVGHAVAALGDAHGGIKIFDEGIARYGG